MSHSRQASCSSQSDSDDDGTRDHGTTSTANTPGNTQSTLGSQVSEAHVTTVEKQTDDVLILNAEDDKELTELLGSAPAPPTIFSKPIPNDVATRWEHLTVNGLSDLDRQKLTKDCFVPENCKLIAAPVLNPEVEATLSTYTKTRDQQLAAFQGQLSYGLSALGKSMSVALNTRSEKVHLKAVLDPIISSVNEAAKLFLDTQYSISTHRRSLLMSNISNPSMKKVLEGSRIGSFLFGEELATKIKSAQDLTKTISSISSSAKSTKRAAENTQKPSKKGSYSRQENNKSLNYKRPFVQESQSSTSGRRYNYKQN